MAVNLISSNDINITQTGSDITLDFNSNAVANKNVYSTTETRIGTWINGKPLYRKIITDSMPVVSQSGTSATKIVSLASLNMSEYMIEFSTIKYGNRRFFFPWFSGSLTTNISINNNKELVVSSNMTDFNTSTWVCSLLYTKTTD